MEVIELNWVKMSGSQLVGPPVIPGAAEDGGKSSFRVEDLSLSILADPQNHSVVLAQVQKILKESSHDVDIGRLRTEVGTATRELAVARRERDAARHAEETVNRQLTQLRGTNAGRAVQEAQASRALAWQRLAEETRQLGIVRRERDQAMTDTDTLRQQQQQDQRLIDELQGDLDEANTLAARYQKERNLARCQAQVLRHQRDENRDIIDGLKQQLVDLGQQKKELRAERKVELDKVNENAAMVYKQDRQMDALDAKIAELRNTIHWLEHCNRAMMQLQVVRGRTMRQVQADLYIGMRHDSLADLINPSAGFAPTAAYATSCLYGVGGTPGQTMEQRHAELEQEYQAMVQQAEQQGVQVPHERYKNRRKETLWRYSG